MFDQERISRVNQFAVGKFLCGFGQIFPIKVRQMSFPDLPELKFEVREQYEKHFRRRPKNQLFERENARPARQHPPWFGRELEPRR